MGLRAFLIGGAVAAALGSCRPEEKAPPTVTSAAPPLTVSLSAEAIRTAGIETAVVGETNLERVLTLTGTVAAKPWIPEEQKALTDAESADAKLRLDEASFQRLLRLYADRIAARQDLDAARAERDQARAAAAQADAARDNLGLSGASRSLEARAKIWGLASLPESELDEVRAGEAVTVSTEASRGKSFRGQVVGVSRSADPETRNFTVRVAIEDPAGLLHPQMLAKFAISTPASAGLAVPRSAVLLEGDGSWVYVAEGRAFRKQRVETGPATAEAIRITGGLSQGQRIVTQGAETLEAERLKSRLLPAERD
jgi:multidrug efflux pump subunit AcrA (membrane-fusion protein)